MSRDWGWVHATDESDQWDGFNDSGIEHFRGKPIIHLAREIIQNSLDARVSGDEPVVVKIRLHKVPTISIPDIEQLRENIKLCLDAAEDPECGEGPKAADFFRRAYEVINKNEISVLEISDFNTSGIVGPCINGKPYYAFMKASGQSVKQSDTASGSYGIGKFAPYAVSSLRTIFVSTVYKDDKGNDIQLTQAKAILTSYFTKDKTTRKGVGFWGKKHKCMPVEGYQHDLPAWIQRVNNNDGELKFSCGTKLSILGFTEPADWEEHLVVSVAENFFGAILDGKLIVDVNGKHNLSTESLKELFQDESLRAIIEDYQDEPETFDACRNYVLCLAESENVEKVESQMPDLGHVELKILVRDGMHKRVCFLRNGMFITDQLHGLKRFSDYKDFVAVFQCLNHEGNQLLRAMEPPRHDDFEPDRLSTEEEKKRGRKILRRLARWVRDKLKEHAQEPAAEVTEIVELRHFFGDEVDDGEGESVDEINPMGEILIRAKPVRRKQVALPRGEDEVAVGREDLTYLYEASEEVKDPREHLGGTYDERGNQERLVRLQVPLSNVRAVVINENTRRLAFTVAFSGNIELRVFATGADTDYQIPISVANVGTLSGGKLRLTVEEGQRYHVEVQFREAFRGAVRVIAYEV